MMCSGLRAEDIFNPWVKGWHFFSSDVDGLSGGLLTTFNPKIKVLKSDFLPSCIVVQVLESWLNSTFKICNVYGPYVNKHPFWEHLSTSNILNDGDLILGGT
jgi:hypothetical protein